MCLQSLIGFETLYFLGSVVRGPAVEEVTDAGLPTREMGADAGGVAAADFATGLGAATVFAGILIFEGSLFCVKDLELVVCGGATAHASVFMQTKYWTMACKWSYKKHSASGRGANVCALGLTL